MIDNKLGRLPNDVPATDVEPREGRASPDAARSCEVVQDGRIYIEAINRPFLYVDKGNRRSMQRASRSPSSADGSRLIGAELSFASNRPGAICSHEDRTARARPLTKITVAKDAIER